MTPRLLVSGLAAAFLVTGPIAAQVPGSSAATVQGLEEVIVAAQKRPENIQTVPISGMTKGFDLANQVPNMNIDAPVADSNVRYFLRGVGTQDFNTLATSPIALSIDDVYLGDHSHEFSEFLRHAARGSALGATGNALSRNILIYMGRDGI